MRPGLRPRPRPTRPLGVAVLGNSGLILRVPGGLVGGPNALRPVVPGAVELHPVHDPVELVAAVGVGGPEVIERVELSEIPERVLLRLGHGELPGPAAAVSLPRADPEALGGLLEEEPRLLPRVERRDEEARGEADGARRGRDEVGEVAEGGRGGEPARPGGPRGRPRLARPKGPSGRAPPDPPRPDRGSPHSPRFHYPAAAPPPSRLPPRSPHPRRRETAG